MVGDQITVTWGKEYYQVTQFNGFEVGPFSIVVTVQPGETDVAAFTRGWNTLEGHATLMWKTKRDGFTERWRNNK